jgi:hypothetical protein
MRGFKRAVVWGCELHQHTNSYVYASFYKAFKSMGFEAYWLNERSDVSGMDFADTLFVTEGQHDGNIPIRDDCKYVLHNCNPDKYRPLAYENKLMLQVYTDDVLQWETEKLDDGTFFSRSGRGLFQSWATDLLPDEIDLAWADLPRKREIHWVGTLCGGQFGNIDEVGRFRDTARAHGIQFHHHPPGSTSFEDNKRLIQESYMAPAIHGTWQAQKGYIACRIFKNISYGHLGVTNCKAAYDLFHQKIVFCNDTDQLFYEAEKRLGDKAGIVEMMKLVRDKHTYVNRVKSILDVI